MDKQPTGNFVAFINRDKQPGDKRPMFIPSRCGHTSSPIPKRVK